VSEINVRDGYGVGPLGYAMMHLSRSRNDAVAQAVVNDLLLVRPNMQRQGDGVMSPLVSRPHREFLQLSNCWHIFVLDCCPFLGHLWATHTG
jgi:hypothetical protein